MGTLNEGREELYLAEVVERALVVLAPLRVRPVVVIRRLQDQSADALHPGLHVEEHAAHVRVLDDGNAGRLRVLEIFDAGALLAIAGVLERIQVRRTATEPTPTPMRAKFISRNISDASCSLPPTASRRSRRFPKFSTQVADR
jgi:hypothetical protein